MECDNQNQETINTITNLDTKKPQLYKIILLNDDFTTQDFVVAILITIFKKEINEAKDLMLEIHTNGEGVAGVYTYDIAASKAFQVSSISSENGFPLACRLEKI